MCACVCEDDNSLTERHSEKEIRTCIHSQAQAYSWIWIYTHTECHFDSVTRRVEIYICWNTALFWIYCWFFILLLFVYLFICCYFIFATLVIVASVCFFFCIRIQKPKFVAIKHHSAQQLNKLQNRKKSFKRDERKTTQSISWIFEKWIAQSNK